MKPIDDKKETVTIRAKSGDEEGRKRVEKVELDTHNIDTIKHVEKKLIDKGVQRRERHPIDGLPLSRGPPKSGHGGKYTWEGPNDLVDNELSGVPAAIDEKDPNYVDDDEVLGDEDVAGVVIGEVEVPKAEEAKSGVGRVEVDPRLNAQLNA